MPCCTVTKEENIPKITNTKMIIEKLIILIFEDERILTFTNNNIVYKVPKEKFFSVKDSV